MVSVLRLKPGTVIGNDFVIARMLAKGGMGAVYVAEQRSTGVERALKVMHPHLLDDQKSRDRFTQEARVCARIESEHVVKVLAAGIDGDDKIPWIAMELIKGEDLEAFAAARAPLPAEQVLEVLRQLCHGLGAAHRLGIVHRDLKPQNVYVAPSQRSDAPFTVKVLDFGISKVALDDGESDTTAAVGSPMWMAPEQARKGRLSPATDVWPLALMTFRLLTGKYYWHAANKGAVIPVKDVLVELLTKRLEAPSARAAAVGGAAVPPGFDAWFARATERDPAQRFADANAALDAIVPVLGGRGSDAPAVTPREGAATATDDPGDLRASSTIPPETSPIPLASVKTAEGEAAPPAPAPQRSRELYVAVAGVLVLSLVVVALLATR